MKAVLAMQMGTVVFTYLERFTLVTHSHKQARLTSTYQPLSKGIQCDVNTIQSYSVDHTAHTGAYAYCCSWWNYVCWDLQVVSAEPTRQIFSLNQLSRRPGVFAPTLVHVIYYYARVFCRKLLWRSNFVEERECLCACVFVAWMLLRGNPCSCLFKQRLCDLRPWYKLGSDCYWIGSERNLKQGWCSQQ